MPYSIDSDDTLDSEYDDDDDDDDGDNNNDYPTTRIRIFLLPLQELFGIRFPGPKLGWRTNNYK